MRKILHHEVSLGRPYYALSSESLFYNVKNNPEFIIFIILKILVG